MKKIALSILLLANIPTTEVLSQKGPARYFGQPILTDSLSTLFIPTRYNEAFLASNKIAFWGDYYANVVVYDFKNDSYKRLFDKDTFIESFRVSNRYSGYSSRSQGKIENVTDKWVFLLVKNKDTNISGRIDEKDPSVLFAVSSNGAILKQLTDETENVVDFELFEKQGFALVKLQRDSDHDLSFKNEDKDFYFRKVNLIDLTLGKPIELN